MGRSIGRITKFCPVAGVMINKTQEEIEAEGDKNKDQLFMAELSKIANSIIPMLQTEEDSPSNHPELDNKVPILDMGGRQTPPCPRDGRWYQSLQLH